MKKTITLKVSGTLLLDAIAIVFIIFLGDLSRIVGYPLHTLDPMRMMIILAFAFTPRWNGWVLAIALPAAAFFLGAHPPMAKAILMGLELLLNVWLFWYLYDKTKSSILSILISIVFSKVFYYILKYLCINQGWLTGNIMDTGLEIQLITTLVFTLFIFIVFQFGGQSKK